MHRGIITLWSLNPTFHFTLQQNTCSLSTQCIHITGNKVCVNGWSHKGNQRDKCLPASLLGFTTSCMSAQWNSTCPFLFHGWLGNDRMVCLSCTHRCFTATVMDYSIVRPLCLRLDCFVLMHSLFSFSFNLVQNTHVIFRFMCDWKDSECLWSVFHLLTKLLEQRGKFIWIRTYEYF